MPFHTPFLNFSKVHHLLYGSCLGLGNALWYCCHHVSSKLCLIIRYSFFCLKEAFGSSPSWLLWLRYSTFVVLYPTGISSEVGLIYIALPFIKASVKYCIRMPNKWNFSFDYFCAAIVVLGIYVPGSIHLYSYMLAQRKKALSKSKKE
ncbi:very-long-chain (3R)-3-hydroxyacyl-CoA dehydratase PASTICCINO 2A-like [Vigna umbellata]|uniref:very-long-chain (3R)-3-hydroxyacyl-CoA dehydratase PASTICCINO 2A-like n=1 Tax=Vigna umbellata TaxID=87088 RepID=UPI001F5F78C4|nr:very-long-chain (3R)-3-hydroxyacyl-CoA dehydratase PASTICCINO 2A-like [Vigna umbellata]